MNLKEQDKFIKSIETLFNQKCDYIFHDMAEDWLHIDVLHLGPTEKFPFNKLITMGESDFKMPKKNYLGIKRNEYMIFYDKNIYVKDIMTILNIKEKTTPYQDITNEFITAYNNYKNLDIRITNDILLKWYKNNGFYLHNIDFNYKNSNYHTKNTDKVTKEILITNY